MGKILYEEEPYGKAGGKEGENLLEEKSRERGELKKLVDRIAKKIFEHPRTKVQRR